MKLQVGRYVHLLSSSESSIAFNSLTMDAFELETSEVELLSSFREPRDADRPDEEAAIAEFVAHGLLVDPENNAPGQASSQLNQRRAGQRRAGGGAFRTLRLALTEQCNMACSYCFQQSLYPDEQPRMAPETLHNTLDWFLGQAKGGQVSVQYFGGEPLMEWPLVQASHQRLLDAQSSGLLTGFSEIMTTNGTLVTPERAKWLFERDFDLAFSFDGPPEQNDAQRQFKNGKGTYHKAAAGLRNWVAVGGQSSLLMTATAENVGNISEIVRWFVEESGLNPEVIGLNSPQPTPHGWETGGAVLARSVHAIWTYCESRGIVFNGPGTFIPLHLRSQRPQSDNCVDREGLAQDSQGGAWPVYVSADGRRSRCLVSHRDKRIEMPKEADFRELGSLWHRGNDTSLDCDGCIASQLCGGPCTIERLMWKGALNQDRCGFMREMTRQVLLGVPT